MSTTLPNGLIQINEGNTSWYADIAHNWSTLDALIGTVNALPAPNDGQLTLRVNNTNIGTFTANQAAGTTVDIPVPTRTSDLVNDSDYITSDAVPPFATTGEINALASEFDTLWGA